MYCLEKNQTKHETWITIRDEKLANAIIESLGDKDKKAILNACNGNSNIVSKILETCNIPHSSAYRKFYELLNDGLIIISGFIVKSGDRKLCKYTSMFESLRIKFERNLVVVQIKPQKTPLQESTISENTLKFKPIIAN